VTVGAAEVTEQIFILLDPAWDVMFFSRSALFTSLITNW